MPIGDVTKNICTHSYSAMTEDILLGEYCLTHTFWLIFAFGENDLAGHLARPGWQCSL